MIKWSYQLAQLLKYTAACYKIDICMIWNLAEYTIQTTGKINNKPNPIIWGVLKTAASPTQGFTRKLTKPAKMPLVIVKNLAVRPQLLQPNKPFLGSFLLHNSIDRQAQQRKATKMGSSERAWKPHKDTTSKRHEYPHELQTRWNALALAVMNQ